jgi:hypothetical protein
VTKRFSPLEIAEVLAAAVLPEAMPILSGP